MRDAEIIRLAAVAERGPDRSELVVQPVGRHKHPVLANMALALEQEDLDEARRQLCKVRAEDESRLAPHFACARYTLARFEHDKRRARVHMKRALETAVTWPDEEIAAIAFANASSFLTDLDGDPRRALAMARAGIEFHHKVAIAWQNNFVALTMMDARKAAADELVRLHTMWPEFVNDSTLMTAFARDPDVAIVRDLLSEV